MFLYVNSGGGATKFLTCDFYVELNSTYQSDSLPLINILNDWMSNEWVEDQ